VIEVADAKSRETIIAAIKQVADEGG